MDARAHVVHHPIRPEAILAEVGDDGHGAALLFLGTVRNEADGRPVERLVYEAYEPMARDVLEAILREVGELAGVDRLVASHRVGELEVGEISVAIAVSAAHRAAAYEASRRIIEEIKRRLPVWKKEIYAGGGEAWVEGSEPGPAKRTGAASP